MGEQSFVTDGGLEPTLIYQHGVELRDFAAFELLGGDLSLAVAADGCGVSTAQTAYFSRVSTCTFE